MKKLFLLVALCTSVIAHAQQPTTKREGWHLLDPQADGYMGISLNKAYDLLKGRKSTPVIVAVIDSGIDTAHPDLKPNLWRNEREIAGNAKDDDGNGYPDDVYGWNFAGARNGENVVHNSWEITRVYHNWKKDFEGKQASDVPAGQRFLYEQWVKAAAMINKDYEEASKELPQIEELLGILEVTANNITAHLGEKEFNATQAETLITNKNEQLARSAKVWKQLFSQSTDPSVKQTAILDEITNYKNTLAGKVSRKKDQPIDTRGALTGDRYTDINDRFYGNNNLGTGSGDHGTLVSGVIGAVRGNGMGIDGIADNVRIMAVRAVPGGDEHDKDIALAIRYAVDNGAVIINMSFGKPVSPYKHFVDDAVRYAASKGVLLVHGSGNDGKDITKDVFYPHPLFLDGKKAENYLTVGASGDPSTGGYAATFSNYSAEYVDLFAPGTYIYSTAAGNRYVGADGTSLAAPVVTGVAALLKSYFPGLTPAQMVRILKGSGMQLSQQVILPGGEQEVPFSRLSSSGRIVNAYAAVKLALQEEKN